MAIAFVSKNPICWFGHFTSDINAIKFSNNIPLTETQSQLGFSHTQTP